MCLNERIRPEYAGLLSQKHLIGMRVDDLVNDPSRWPTPAETGLTRNQYGWPLFSLYKNPKRDQLEFICIKTIPLHYKNRKIKGIIGSAVENECTHRDVHALQEKLASTSRKLEETETALRVSC